MIHSMQTHSSIAWLLLSNNLGKLSFLVILISICCSFSNMWPLPLWRYFLASNQSEHRWEKISGLSQEVIKKVSKLLGRWWVCFWGSFPYLSLQGLCWVGDDHGEKVTLPDKLPMHGCNTHFMWPACCEVWRDILEELENIPQVPSQATVCIPNTEMRALTMYKLSWNHSASCIFHGTSHNIAQSKKAASRSKWQQHGPYLSLGPWSNISGISDIPKP